MKHIVATILLLVASQWAGAQTWQPIGHRYEGQPFEGYATGSKMAIDKQGNLYLTFYDNHSAGKATVRQFNGHAWEDVGVPLFSRWLLESNVAVDPQGNPYVIYRDENVVARKFNGQTWDTVGVYSGMVTPNSIAIDSAGTTYVSVINYADDNRPTVLKLVGDTWQTVGKKGFTNSSSSAQLVIAPDGTLYAACTSLSRQLGSVWKFNGNDWEIVGTSSFMANIIFPRLAIDREGTLYLAYLSRSSPDKAMVSKFNGSTWTTVGNAAFASVGKTYYALPVDIALDTTGHPYVAFVDKAQENKATVMRLNGNHWEAAGNTAFSDYKIDGVFITTDAAGTPYVTYSDMYTGADDDFYKVRVQRLNGDKWESLSDTGITSGNSYIFSTAVDPQGALYLAYSHNFYNSFAEKRHNTTVMKYENNQWQKLGADHVWNASKEKMAVDSKGQVYLAYEDENYGKKITVEKFNGSNWEILGNAGFSEAPAIPSIAVDTSGTPYVAYAYGDNGKTTRVKKLIGDKWMQVGQAAVADSTDKPCIAIDRAGTPYVSYMDQTNKGNTVVKKFMANEWTMVGNQEPAKIPVYESYMFLDANGVPWTMTYWNNFMLSIKKLKDNLWETVYENTYPANERAGRLVFGRDGNVYVPFADKMREAKGSVIRYDGKSWEFFGNAGFTKDQVWQIHFLEDGKGNFYVIYNNEGLWFYKYVDNCLNPTDGGTIAGNQSGCDAFDPSPIISLSIPSGSVGTLEYKWQRSIQGSTVGFNDIGHTGETYDPGVLQQTTWFRRLARVSCLTDWSGAAASNAVKITVVTLPALVCPANDTLFTDPGTLTARKSYSALPEGTPDTLAIYSIDGKDITFPFDFPIGTTTVEVKANSQCAVDVACSFTVTVRQATGMGQLDAQPLSLQVYPNPFTAKLPIEIANPSRKEVSVEIFSMTGQKIKSLAKAIKEAIISLSWNGCNEEGQQVPDGMYLLKVNGEVRKVVKR